MKFILSLMMIIAGIFIAQSSFAVTPTIQEALNPPDNFVVMASVPSPDGQPKFIYEASQMVAPLIYKLSHLNSYIINKNKTGLNTIYLIAGFKDEFQGVETVLKFPFLIHPVVNINKEILAVGLVS